MMNVNTVITTRRIFRIIESNISRSEKAAGAKLKKKSKSRHIKQNVDK